MRRVRHLHCVSIITSFTDMDSVALLSYPVADMDLAAFLDMDLNVLQLSTLRSAVGCITAALSYLHEQGIRYVIRAKMVIGRLTSIDTTISSPITSLCTIQIFYLRTLVSGISIANNEFHIAID
jgi:hypothetical protein